MDLMGSRFSWVTGSASRGPIPEMMKFHSLNHCQYGPGSVAEPDPGSGAFLTPRSRIRVPGWVKDQDPDPG
jgi:hypothetical protein